MATGSEDLRDAFLALASALLRRGITTMPDLHFSSAKDTIPVLQALAQEGLYPPADGLPDGVPASFFGFLIKPPITAPPSAETPGSQPSPL